MYQQASSDTQGIATLSLSPDINTGSSGIFRATKYKKPTEDVLQVTLSDLLVS